MTDHFAPPDEEPITKPRPGLCKNVGPAGERCYLYWDHEAEYHWDGKVRWIGKGYVSVRR